VRFLTPRQRAILEYIRRHQVERGVAPTHREICEQFGFASYGTAYKHLRLLSEKGYLRREAHQRRGMVLLPPATQEEPAVAERLPFLGRIAAGRPIEAVAEAESVEVPPLLLSGRRQEHFVLRVVGNSMIDEGIHDGDWVVVERRDEAEAGEMVVALVGQDVTLKHFFPEGEMVRLQPANAALTPIRIAARDVRVQGVVVGLMRKF